MESASSALSDSAEFSMPNTYSNSESSSGKLLRSQGWNGKKKWVPSQLGFGRELMLVDDVGAVASMSRTSSLSRRTLPLVPFDLPEIMPRSMASPSHLHLLQTQTGPH